MKPLDAEAAAKLLSKASGFDVRPEMIEADIEAGAPTDEDGSINFLNSQ